MDTIYIDPTFYTDKPTDNNRLSKELQVYDLLESLNIPYIRLDHDVTSTIEACKDVEKLLEIDICKNLFLTNSQKSQYYLLLMPGDKAFKTAKVSKQIGSSRLSFGSSEAMEEMMNLTPGSVSVLGLMNDREHKITLLIDEEISKWEYVGCHPNVNTSSLKLKTSDLFSKFLAHTGHKPVWVTIE